MTDLEIDIAGQRVLCLPERSLYWPAASTLLVADAHWGKASTFRAAAIPIPDNTTHDLDRLATAIRRMEARRVIFLGDLLHAKEGRADSVMDLIAAWRAGL